MGRWRFIVLVPKEIDIQADWQEPIDHPRKPMTSENLNEWLFVKGSAAPFEVKISYIPSRKTGPVVGRGIPDVDEGVEEDLEDLDEEFSEDSQPDAREMPVLPEVMSRAVPAGGNPMEVEEETAEGGVIGRAVSKGRIKAPIRTKVGPPPYDERPFRCAAAPPPAPPAKYGELVSLPGAPSIWRHEVSMCGLYGYRYFSISRIFQTDAG